MAKQTVNLGTSANKGDGDPLRTAFDKVNDNFDELYARDINTDFSASVFGDDSTLLVDAVNNKIVGPVDTASVDAVSLRTSATSIALGYEAGNTGQGANAIAIGEKAGYANQAANSIVINATGAEVYNFGASSLVITPIRNDTMVTILGYDADTGQVTHNAAIPGYTNTADLKALVAASADFADFQTRIAAL